MRYAKLTVLLGLMVALFSMGQAFAGQNGGGGGGAGRFDPEEMRKRLQDRIKEALGSTDEEWKALQPKIEAVQKAQTESRVNNFGGGAGFGRRGGGGGGGGGGAAAADEPAKTDLQKKNDELKTVLANKDAETKAIQDALKAFRDQRETARANLKKAQEALKELLTAKQEAVLVMQNILE